MTMVWMAGASRFAMVLFPELGAPEIWMKSLRDMAMALRWVCGRRHLNEAAQKDTAKVQPKIFGRSLTLPRKKSEAIK